MIEKRYLRICRKMTAKNPEGSTEVVEINKEKPEVIILDDNELSILKYAEEYPENWKKICKALDKSKRHKTAQEGQKCK